VSKENFANQLPAWAHYLREFGSYGVLVVLLVFYILKLEPVLQNMNATQVKTIEKFERLERVLERLELTSRIEKPR
jgi:hypothetical protein